MSKSRNKKKQLYIITGLSGAGKSTCLRVFEDLRFFAVDGLPPELAPEVAAIMDRDSMRHFPAMAIGMDLRQDDFLRQFDLALDKLGKLDLQTHILFLEADDHDITRRYASTRRPHPMELDHPGLEAAIAREREMLAPIREKADLVIDSTGFSIHDLRRKILRQALKQAEHTRNLRVNIISFGFKYGMPQDADFIFDLRFLDNPYFVERLKRLSGRDKAVADYIFAGKEAREFRKKLLELLFQALELMEDEGRYRVTVAFGCTGGRHRSVAMAEETAQAIRQADFPVTVEHRNIDEDVKRNQEYLVEPGRS